MPPPEVQSAVAMQTPGVEPTEHWPLRVAWVGARRASRRKGRAAAIAILVRRGGAARKGNVGMCCEMLLNVFSMC